MKSFTTPIFSVGVVLLLFFPTLLPAQTASDTFRLQVCNHYWKTGLPVAGMQVENGTPLDASGYCSEVRFTPAAQVNGFCPIATNNDNSQARNGVTVYDLVKIGRHIIGMDPLEPSYLQRAADANKSGSVTTFDIVELQKVILGIYTDFPNNTTWHFFSENLFLPFGNCNYMPPAGANTDAVSLLALKTGDVDGDTNLDGPYPLPTTPGVALEIPDIAIVTGQTLEIPVFLKNTQATYGMQFTLQLGQGQLKVTGLIPQLGSSLNDFGLFLNLNAVSFCHPNYNAQLVVQANDNPILVLQVTALADGKLSDFITLSNTITPGIFIDQNDTLHPMTLGFRQTSALHEPLAVLKAHPAFPNPFDSYTDITLELDHSGPAHLEVYDATGKLCWQTTQDLAVGRQSMRIPGAAFPAGGVGFIGCVL